MGSKFVTHFIKFSFGGVISAAISFFSTPIITALILPAEFGKASMFVLAFSFLQQLISLGLDQSFVRFFFHKKYSHNPSILLSNIVIPLGLILALVIILILIFWKLISIAIIDIPSFKLAVLLSIALFFSVVERFSTLVIRMFQHAVLFSNLKIIQAFTNTAAVILFAYFIEKSFFAIVCGYLVSTILVSIIGIVIKWKFWAGKLEFNKSIVCELLKYGLPFVPAFIISWVFEGIDKMALRHYSNFSEIGIYSAASKIVAILTVLQVTFSNFWTPISYEAYEKNSLESKKLFESVYTGLSAFFFIAALLVIMGKNLIIHLFSESYSDAMLVMPSLIFIPIMYTLSEITVGGINFVKKTHLHFCISAFAAIVNLIGVIILVPKFGAKGAAISTGLAYIVFFYARTLLSTHYFPINFQILKTTVSILILFFIALLNSFVENIFICFGSNMLALMVIITLYLKSIILIYHKNIKTLI